MSTTCALVGADGYPYVLAGFIGLLILLAFITARHGVAGFSTAIDAITRLVVAVIIAVRRRG